MGVIIRQSIKGTIANYVGVAIGFVTTFFVLTRFLTAEEIGLTRVLVDAATLLVALAQLGTSSSIVRYYPYFKDEAHGDHGFFFWTLLVPLIGFVFFGALYIALRTPIEAAFAEKSPLFVEYYYAVLPLAFFMLYMAIFESNANVLMRIVVPKITREVIVRILALAAYLLYAFNVLTLNGFVIMFCSVYGIATVINLVYLCSLHRISLRPDTQHITPTLRRDYLLYTAFVLTSACATAVTPVISTFFISAQQGLAFTGVFAIATYIATIIDIPYRSLGAIAQPQLSQAVKDNDTAGANRLCQNVSLHQLVVGAFLFFVIWSNIDLFFALLPNGTHYATAKNVVLILGISKLINSTLSIGTSVLSYSRYYYFSLIFAFLQTALAIFFNNRLIPLWGIDGAAMATLFAYLFYYIALLIVVRFTVKTTPFSWQQIKVLLIIILMFALDAICRFGIRHLYPAIGDNLWLQCAEAVICTALIGLFGVWCVYKWNISAEIRQLITTILHRPHA
ncbi:MAG: lipopolysaccharide biosynthesis protein [Paludibacteraceae bacterium]